MRAFCYARATLNDGGISVSQQKSAVKEHYAMHLRAEGYRFGGFIADLAERGNVPLTERPGGWKLYARLQRDDALVVYSLDLLFWGVHDGVQSADSLIGRGVRLVSLLDEVDTARLNGGAVTASRLLSALADLDGARLSERIRAGMDRARREGRALNAEKPWGLRRYRRRGKVFLVPDLGEQKTMEDVVRLHDNDRMTFAEIARHFRRAGRKRNGRSWSTRMCETAYRRRMEFLGSEAVLPERQSGATEPTQST